MPALTHCRYRYAIATPTFSGILADCLSLLTLPYRCSLPFYTSWPKLVTSFAIFSDITQYRDANVSSAFSSSCACECMHTAAYCLFTFASHVWTESRLLRSYTYTYRLYLSFVLLICAFSVFAGCEVYRAGDFLTPFPTDVRLTKPQLRPVIPGYLNGLRIATFGW